MPEALDRIYRKVVEQVREAHPNWSNDKIVETAWKISWSIYKRKYK